MLRKKPRAEHVVRGDGLLSTLETESRPEALRQGSNLRIRTSLLAAGLLIVTTGARADLISNGNFASVSPSLATNGICTTNPAVYPAVDPGFYPACTAFGWSGSYQIGNGKTIGYAGVSFGIPQPDPGSSGDALILQAEHNVYPTATQSIDIATAGEYTLSFYVANRSSPAADAGPQTISVLLDGLLLTGGTFDHLPGSWTLETLNFDMDAGSHSLTLEGLDETSGATASNVAAFVDDVSLVPAVTATPEPSSLFTCGLALLVARSWMSVHRKRRAKSA